MSRGGPGTAEFSRRFDYLNGEPPRWLELVGLVLLLLCAVAPASGVIAALSWLGAPGLLSALASMAALVASVAALSRVAPWLRGHLVLRLRHRRRRALARMNLARRQAAVLRRDHVAPTPGVRGRRP